MKPTRSRHGGGGQRPPAPEALPATVVDNHCHLDIADSEDGGWLSIDDALAEAAAVGVTRIVQIGCDLVGARWAVDAASAYPSVVAGVALHPNEAPRLSARGELDAALAEIAELAESPVVRAVGETGLDYFRTGPEGREAQWYSFKTHIELAKRLHKTLVIHDREAHADVLAVIDSPDPETIVNRLQPLADVARVLQQRIAVTSYADVMANASDHYHDGQGDPAVRSGLLNHITPEFAEGAKRLIEGGGSYFFQIRSMGGAVADVPPDATAFPNRSANFSVVAFGPSRSRLNAYWDKLNPHFDGLYLSFETDTSPERLLEAFPEPALSKLRALKATYDPSNLFRDNFNVGATVPAR